MRSEYPKLFSVAFFAESRRSFPVATPSEEEFYNVRLIRFEDLLPDMLMHPSYRRRSRRISSAKSTPSERIGQARKRCGTSWP